MKIFLISFFLFVISIPKSTLEADACKTGVINWAIVNKVNKWLGTPVALLGAMRGQEYGKEFLEFGHKGKTGWIQRECTQHERQYFEAGRTANKLAIEFAMKYHREEFIKFLAQGYTIPKSAPVWEKNVLILEKQFQSPNGRKYVKRK